VAGVSADWRYASQLTYGTPSAGSGVIAGGGMTITIYYDCPVCGEENKELNACGCNPFEAAIKSLEVADHYFYKRGDDDKLGDYVSDALNLLKPLRCDWINYPAEIPFVDDNYLVWVKYTGPEKLSKMQWFDICYFDGTKFTGGIFSNTADEFITNWKSVFSPEVPK
jgi:hypothetical protein